MYGYNLLNTAFDLSYRGTSISASPGSINNQIPHLTVDLKTITFLAWPR